MLRRRHHEADMEAGLQFTIEAHSAAATLYLRGPLSVSGALTAVVACEQLPEAIRTLRLDAAATRADDAREYDLLRALVEAWHSRRRTVARRAEPPRWGRRDTSVANPCMIRDLGWRL
jgi:hypothetical protein